MSSFTIGKRSLDDPRALLVKEYARIIQEIKPEFFVFENVKGFPSFSKGKLLNEILEIFDNIGYNFTFGVLNSKYYNVPQRRERFIIIGGLRKKINFPKTSTNLPKIQAGEEGGNLNDMLEEVARIQTFPDDFIFCGNDTEKRIQIGNAIPPLFAKALAEKILQGI